MSDQSTGTPPRGAPAPKESSETSPETLVGRYYQLLSGHAAIGSFLHERITGTQRLESSECWLRNCGR